MADQLAHALACTLVERPTLIHLVLAARAMGITKREGQMELQAEEEQNKEPES